MTGRRYWVMWARTSSVVPIQSGPYAIVPSARGDDPVVVTAGVEVPAGGGFACAHSPRLTRSEQLVGSVGGFGDQHPVQIYPRGRGVGGGGVAPEPGGCEYVE